MAATNQEQGHCPKCGSEDVEYHGVPDRYSNEAIADYEREEIEYQFECSECGHRYQEVYWLVYLRTEAAQ
jgi:C4-type Zn-finger protein